MSVSILNRNNFKHCPKCGTYKIPIKSTLQTEIEYGDTYVYQYDGMEYKCPDCGKVLDRIWFDEEDERL